MVETDKDNAIYEEELSEQEREALRKKKRRRGLWYLAEVLAAAGEVLLLYLFGGRLGIQKPDILFDMLIIEPLVLFMGIWPFFTMPEKLPPLYDKTRISGYSDGFFRINVYGVSFNNRNWPHIVKALRTFFFLTPVCWPIAYVLLRLVVPDFIWRNGRLLAYIAMVLGGLFIPVVALGKKYE